MRTGGLPAADEVAAGASSGCARVGGAVYAWGRNNVGQIADGSTTSRSFPGLVSGLSSGVAQLTVAGNSAYAKLTDGGVRSWGVNTFGQLGDGSTTSRLTPGGVIGLTAGVSQIVGGQLSCYALVGGGVQAWGYVSTGSSETELERTVRRPSPYRDSPLELTSDTMKAWGENRYGELGDGTSITCTSAVDVTGVAEVKARCRMRLTPRGRCPSSAEKPARDTRPASQRSQLG